MSIVENISKMASENEENMEYEEYVQERDKIEADKKELASSEAKNVSKLHLLREKLFRSLESEDLINGSIMNFDETGTFLGLPREIQEILGSREIDVDDISHVSRAQIVLFCQV